MCSKMDIFFTICGPKCHTFWRYNSTTDNNANFIVHKQHITIQKAIECGKISLSRYTNLTSFFLLYLTLCEVRVTLHYQRPTCVIVNQKLVGFCYSLVLVFFFHLSKEETFISKRIGFLEDVEQLYPWKSGNWPVWNYWLY